MNADKIFDRSENLMRHIARNGAIAVFKIGDTFRTARAGGDLAKRAFEKNPQSLVGVYDERCKPEWMVEDLEYMAGK